MFGLQNLPALFLARSSLLTGSLPKGEGDRQGVVAVLHKFSCGSALCPTVTPSAYPPSLWGGVPRNEAGWVCEFRGYRSTTRATSRNWRPRCRRLGPVAAGDVVPELGRHFQDAEAVPERVQWSGATSTPKPGANVPPSGFQHVAAHGALAGQGLREGLPGPARMPQRARRTTKPRPPDWPVAANSGSGGSRPTVMSACSSQQRRQQLDGVRRRGAEVGVQQQEDWRPRGRRGRPPSGPRLCRRWAGSMTMSAPAARASGSRVVGRAVVHDDDARRSRGAIFKAATVVADARGFVVGRAGARRRAEGVRRSWRRPAPPATTGSALGGRLSGRSRRRRRRRAGRTAGRAGRAAGQCSPQWRSARAW